jgi:hypothetical protein
MAEDHEVKVITDTILNTARRSYADGFAAGRAGSGHCCLQMKMEDDRLIAELTREIVGLRKKASWDLVVVAAINKHRQIMMDLLPEEVFAEISNALQRKSE